MPASRYCKQREVIVIASLFLFFLNMSFFTYILFSEKTNKYYIGYTQDIDKRLERHNAGATPSTKPGRPWKLVYSEEFGSKTEAHKREVHLKRMKSRVYITEAYRGESGQPSRLTVRLRSSRRGASRCKSGRSPRMLGALATEYQEVTNEHL